MVHILRARRRKGTPTASVRGKDCAPIRIARKHGHRIFAHRTVGEVLWGRNPPQVLGSNPNVEVAYHRDEMMVRQLRRATGAGAGAGGSSAQHGVRLEQLGVAAANVSEVEAARVRNRCKPGREDRGVHLRTLVYI